jgi:hypothetical protein
MARNIERIASVLGATVVGQVPETGGGTFGAARLAQIVASLPARLEPGQGRRPGRPTDARWTQHPKVPMSEETVRKLTWLAEFASTAERWVSPMQIAARLLEEAVAQCPADASEMSRTLHRWGSRVARPGATMRQHSSSAQGIASVPSKGRSSGEGDLLLYATPRVRSTFSPLASSHSVGCWCRV